MALENFPLEEGGVKESTAPMPPVKIENFSFAEGVGENPMLRELRTGENLLKSLGRLKAAGGEVASIADMLLSAPGFTLGVAGQLAGTVTAGAQGVPFMPRSGGGATAYDVGRLYGEEVSAPFMNPLEKLFRLASGGEMYTELTEGSNTNRAMGWFGELMARAGLAIEKQSGGKISRNALPMFVDEAMLVGTGGALGPKTLPPGIKARLRAEINRVEPKLEALPIEDLRVTREPIDLLQPVGGPVDPRLDRGAREEISQIPSPSARVRQAELSDLLRAKRAEMYGATPAQEMASAERIFRDFSGERGGITPEMAVGAGVVGGGAVVGAMVDDERGALLGGATGLAALLPFTGRGKGIPLSQYQAGAVKAPGGMWHPKMVEYFGDKLTYQMFRRPEVREANRLATEAAHGRGDPNAMQAEANLEAFIANHSDRMVKNFLNRYAGTERDPLKDVEIPYEAGTIKWGQAWDEALGGYSIEKYVDPPSGAKPGEIIWGLNDLPSGAGPQSAISDYLRHVGDYLATIPLDKLKDYDLVRAVRETSATDARMAKEMEKAAKESTQALPIHKEYPDGYRWVEIKVPEKLTEEQAASVRRSGETYTALDSSGKPIMNRFTQEPARGKTPKAAWTSGQLALEGNQLGHCVGGYCSAVESGESRIFSLRDPSGKSHVTIETAPKAEPGAAVPMEQIGSARSFEGDSILQIKGKQNRAPISDYLPYVQDFVKSGKWGEVGDLGNTGLIDLKAPRNDMYLAPEFLRAIEEFKDKRFVTKEEVQKAVDEDILRTGQRGPGGQQGGGASPEMLKALSSIGIGGLIGWYFNDENPGYGAALGAVAGGLSRVPAVRKGAAEAVELGDYGLGSLSTRIGNLSPALKLSARTFEQKLLQNTHSQLERVVPFMRELTRLPEADRNAISTALFNGDAKGVAQLMEHRPELVAGWREVQNVLREYGETLKDYGRFKKLREDYFPRLVKDVEGLRKAMGRESREATDNLIAAEETKLGRPLTQVEMSAIYNEELFSALYRKPHQIERPGFTRERSVRDVEDLLQYYHTPQESLYQYVGAAQMDLEMARFFGKDLVHRDVGGRQFIDTDASIGNVVGREVREGNLSPDQRRQLEGMLKSRFGAGERAPAGIIRFARNLGYTGLLGNIASASFQTADSVMSIYQSGIRDALGGQVMRLRGEGVKAKDFGLADRLAEEFTNSDATAKWLQRTFRYSGFEAIDRFGKSTVLNAALARGQRLVKSASGVEKLNEKYGKAYGEEFNALVEDLRRGEKTDRVNAYLFSELSDLQPVSKLEVPQLYLDHPNWRLAYMLHTYTLKQFDILRRDVYQEIAKGNKAKGLYNLASYATVLAMAGATADQVRSWINGTPTESLGLAIGENVMKNFGWSAYATDKWSKGEKVGAVTNAFVPPYRMIDDLINGDPRLISYAPLLGAPIYNRWFGGKERKEIAQSRLRGKGDLSPSAQRYLEKRREARKEKRVD